MPKREKSQKKRIETGLIILLIAAIVAVIGIISMLPHQSAFHSPTVVTLGGYSYNVLLALNSSQWQQGLMNYTFSCNTPGGCVNGMLFVFPLDQSLCFWMKNTPQPLYQVWIENNMVTKVYNGTPESTATVCANGSYVLEIYSRLPHNLSVGQSVKIESG
jgi:uncharacterized membrane protein (UPF0127 family)